MSVESFFASNPPTSRFLPAMREHVGFKEMSPVRFLGRRLIREGNKGLVEISDQIARARRTGDRSQVTSSGLTIVANSSSIYLGSTIISIEDIISHGTFDQVSFNSMVEMAYSGTRFRPYLFISPVVEEVPRGTLARITKLAVADRTFGSFFREEFTVLPESLQEFLGEKGYITEIKGTILSDYVRRAGLLVEGKRATQ